MSDVFGIDVSALQAFQQAIEVTSNNVANASTPGYDEESIQLTTAAPQNPGGVPIGAGRGGLGCNPRLQPGGRESAQHLAEQPRRSSPRCKTTPARSTTCSAPPPAGLSTALQTYYSGWSAVADDPTSTAARQALLGDAQSSPPTFNTTSTQLNNLNSDVNTRITADVQQINSIGARSRR